MQPPWNNIINMEVSSLVLLDVRTYSTIEGTSVKSHTRQEPRRSKQGRSHTHVRQTDIPLIVGEYLRRVVQSRGTCPFGPIRFQGSLVDQFREQADRNSQWKETT